MTSSRRLLVSRDSLAEAKWSNKEVAEKLVKAGVPIMPTEKNNTKESTAICGNGMCPYVPCEKYPYCEHIEQIWIDTEKKKGAKPNSSKH